MGWITFHSFSLLQLAESNNSLLLWFNMWLKYAENFYWNVCVSIYSGKMFAGLSALCTHPYFLFHIQGREQTGKGKVNIKLQNLLILGRDLSYFNSLLGPLNSCPFRQEMNKWLQASWFCSYFSHYVALIFSFMVSEPQQSTCWYMCVPVSFHKVT